MGRSTSGFFGNKDTSWRRKTQAGGGVGGAIGPHSHMCSKVANSCRASAGAALSMSYVILSKPPALEGVRRTICCKREKGMSPTSRACCAASFWRAISASPGLCGYSAVHLNAQNLRRNLGRASDPGMAGRGLRPLLTKP